MLVFIGGETADVKATVATLKVRVAEDMYQCDISMFKLSTPPPLYNASSHLLSICFTTAFDKKLPRYVAFAEGHLPYVLPIQIF